MGNSFDIPKSHKQQHTKRKSPRMLKAGNLTVNDSKTEEYTIPNDENWKKCKLLGSMLDTTEDIKRRKGILLTHMKNKKKSITAEDSQ